ncbi:MAG: hypothetical protein RLZ75_464 [Pseudomonadota bacterium]|jgi:hypothetical protein
MSLGLKAITTGVGFIFRGLIIERCDWARMINATWQYS